MPDIKKEKIRKLLMEAFKEDIKNGEIKGYKNYKLTHKRLVKLRLEMCKICAEDLKYCLPYVLEDLLDTHTNDPIKTENIEYVFMYLNVRCYMSQKSRASRIKQFGKEALKEKLDFSTKYNEDSFKTFTKEQAKAIKEWLLYAENWKDVEPDGDDFKGALAYWTKRARGEK